MKILVIGPAWVGDMVMSQSLYRLLKQQHPDALLHVMAPGWCLPLLERMPEVDRAIRMPLGHGEFQLLARWRLGRALKAEGYDWALILPNSLKSALIPLFAGIVRRTGWKGESRYGLLNDLRSNKQDFPMMVQRYMALAFAKPQMRSASDLPAILHPALRIEPQQQTAARSRLGLNSPAPVLGLCPGAEFGPAKRWPDSLCQYCRTLVCAGRSSLDLWLRQGSRGGNQHPQPPLADGAGTVPTADRGDLTDRGHRSARRLCRRGLQRLRTDAHHGSGRNTPGRRLRLHLDHLYPAAE